MTMTTTHERAPSVQRVMVATDRSETAEHAVRWAANLASSHGAQLLVFQVVPAAGADGRAAGVSEEAPGDAGEDLRRVAAELAGARGRARVVVGADPAQAILDAVEEEQVDVLVVGNVGMGGRKQFLLGNIPNRISHGARCTVVIVNTASLDEQRSTGGQRGRKTAPVDPAALTEGMLLGRAWRIGRAGRREGPPPAGRTRHPPGPRPPRDVRPEGGRAPSAAARVRRAGDDRAPLRLPASRARFPP